jgi:hypothetical protein
MNQGSPQRFKELQAVWLERLQSASDQYRQMSATYRVVAQEYQRRVMPSPDGDLSLRQALKEQNLARAEYARTLRTFTDLLLNGIVPEEPPTEK